MRVNGPLVSVVSLQEHGDLELLQELSHYSPGELKRFPAT